MVLCLDNQSVEPGVSLLSHGDGGDGCEHCVRWVKWDGQAKINLELCGETYMSMPV